MRAAGLFPLLLAIGCASTPAPRAPEPLSPAKADEPVVVAVEPPAPSPDGDEAPASTEPLPTHLLLPRAVTVAVVDVAAMRQLGLGQALRLMLRDSLPDGLDACGQRLFDETGRIVFSRELVADSWAMAIDQPQAPERLLECLADELPEAHAQPVAGRAALTLTSTTIAIDIDGTLMIGSERGLATLMGEPHPPPEPIAAPDGAPLDGDITIGSLDSEPRDVREMLPRLELGPDVVVSSVQSLGFGTIGDTRFVIRRRGTGLRITAELSGFGAQLGMLSSVSPHERSFLHETIDQMRSQLVVGLAETDAAAVTALLDPLRIEEHGDDLRLVLDVPDVALAVRALAALSGRRDADRATDDLE